MTRPSLSSRTRSARAVRATLAVGAAAALVLSGATDGLASVVVGSPGDDVTFGTDSDNAGNPLIQPPGVTIPQHLDGGEVVFGRLGDDLLGGRTGSDVLVGGEGDDIMIGGPDSAARSASDVSLGDEGNDVALWGPGDGSETFVGDVGYDTQVVGRLLRNPDGSLKIVNALGRRVPKATVAGGPQSCALTPVPASEGVGEQYLLRVLTNGRLTATLRLRDVERVVCPSSTAGYARVADLTRPQASFREVPVSGLGGVVRAILS